VLTVSTRNEAHLVLIKNLGFDFARTKLCTYPHDFFCLLEPTLLINNLGEIDGGHTTPVFRHLNEIQRHVEFVNEYGSVQRHPR